MRGRGDGSGRPTVSRASARSSVHGRSRSSATATTGRAVHLQGAARRPGGRSVRPDRGDVSQQHRSARRGCAGLQ